MGTALLIARLLLASVFALAGVAKLADRAGSKQAIVDFGVPAPLSEPARNLVTAVRASGGRCSDTYTYRLVGCRRSASAPLTVRHGHSPQFGTRA